MIASGNFDEIVRLVRGVAWPVAVLLILLLYRKHLPALARGLGQRISKISWASVSLEFAVASEVRPEIWSSLRYLRDPTATQQVPDSSRSLFMLIRAGERADSASINLGTGDRWLTSRLFVFTVVLSELLGVRCLAFVGTSGGVPRHFLGLAEPGAVRAALGRRQPWLERAMLEAQLDFNRLQDADLAPFRTFVAKPGKKAAELGSWDIAERVRPLAGAALRSDWFGNAQTAEQLATAFLRNPSLYREVPPTAAEEAGWTRLGASRNDADKQREERAVWIRDGVALDDLLGDALAHPYVVEGPGVTVRELQRQAVPYQDARYVAVIDGGGRFKRLLDRGVIVERLAQEIAEAEAPR